MSKNRKPAASRRDFLKAAGVSAASLLATRAPLFASERSKGANQRLGIGFVGVGGRCQTHLGICLDLKKKGLCDTVAVCDVYRPRLDAAAAKTGGKPYRRYQDLLADPSVDVVCIATPDRHHARQAIDAVRAGKDVYCEKPLTHWSQMDLARQIGQEADEHKRIVQVGTQYVADDAYAKLRKMIADGVVGKILHVQADYFRRGDWGERMTVPDANAKPGPDLDWEQFLGDAPPRPFDPSRFFQWRLYWDYAGGPATDLLVHAFTPAFCMLDLGFPERVFGGGGTFQYNREVPDQCNIVADYAHGPSVVLMNSLSNHTGIETILRGTDGVIIFKGIDQKDTKDGIRIVPMKKKGPPITIPWTSAGDTSRLWTNLLDCVRTRQRPYSPIDVAVRVQAPLNMGIISHREGKVARFDANTGKILLQ